MIVVLWPRYWWQIAVALILSMLGFSMFQTPANEWLGWLGAVGGLVTHLVLQMSEGRLLFFGVTVGFVVNVAFISLVLILATRLLTRAKGRLAVDH